MPLSSLPSPYGIGTMGKEAYRFADFLEAAGQKYWQLLPLGPSNCGDSPYSSLSTFAGNPLFIDLDLLKEDGLLNEEDLSEIDWGTDPEIVDYERVRQNRYPVLRKAFLNGKDMFSDEVALFHQQNAGWLDNYALYMSVKKKYRDAGWQEWPEEIRLRNPDAMERYRKELAEEIDFWIFIQFLFYRQWDALRTYVHNKGIGFIGDVPIYVAMDSADVWGETQFFQLDEKGKPVEVAGVPPDAFTEEGQLWGNPLFDWDRMKADGYGWWIRRIEGAQKLYDVIRIDHFRGFESYWSVPATEKTAINGHWVKGPGLDLVHVLTSWFYGLEYIAEDLGIITPEVAGLVKDSGLPGMKVLQFAFDSEGDSVYLPHNISDSNSVCFVGTHDNDTVLGWVEKLSDADRSFAADYMHITEDEGWCEGMIRTGMATPSGLFVVPMQDVLELPGSCRMNMPGVPDGNWRWRMLPRAATEEKAARLLALTKRYRR